MTTILLSLLHVLRDLYITSNANYNGSAKQVVLGYIV